MTVAAVSWRANYMLSRERDDQRDGENGERLNAEKRGQRAAEKILGCETCSPRLLILRPSALDLSL